MWLVSRAHAVLGQGDAALHHADRSAAVVAAAGLADFDLAYAHEARARALACLGRLDEAEAELAAARAVPIADDEDRQIVDGDLAAGPWFGLAAAAPPPPPTASDESHGQKWPRTSHGTGHRRHRRPAHRRYGWTMSVKVELGELGAKIGEFEFAYLVTVSEDGHAHVLSVWPDVTDEGLVVDGVGRHSQANATAHPDVTLVFPPADPAGYSLLVDGGATVDGSTVTVAPSKAILHRPAPGPDGRRAGSDCVDVTVTE